MSAIHGLYTPQTKIDASTTESIMQSSDYWNPDKQSIDTNNQSTCFLGKAHLFNLPNSEQDVVFKDAETGSLITSNARIDNREDLLKKLTISDAHISNSELILQSYFHWNKDCVKHLLGDFAFIIWDEAEQKIFAARDHFGIKTLLYHQKEEGILISNEPKSLADSGWLNPKIKPAWIVSQLWSLRGSNRETTFEGLEILPPAHYLEFDKNGTLSIEQYWELKDRKGIDKLSEEEVIEQFKALFQQAIKRRLPSDYQLSCQLSEGLDSNGIAGYAAKFLPDQEILTYSYASVKLNEETKSIWEKTYADIQAMLDMHPNLKAIWTEREMPNSLYDDLVRNTAGSMNIRGQFMSHCWLANERDSRVMLSGWGGDHCVSSPGDFYESEPFSKGQWLKTYRFLKQKEKRGRITKPHRKFLRLFVKHYSPSYFTKVCMKRSGLEQSMAYRHKNNIVKREYLDQFGFSQELQTFIKNYQARYSAKDYSQRELFEVGVEKRIMDSEFTGRQFRLEYRFPMLDVELVEFAYNIPSYLLVKNGVERHAYREIIKGVTTERIRLRRKADVNHPNFTDREHLSKEDAQKMDELFGLPMIKAFIHQDKIEQVKNAQGAKMNYIGLSSLFKYLTEKGYKHGV